LKLSSTKQLLKLLEGPEILILPGCYDAFSAKLIERIGFPAAFMGGFAVSASRLGVPDTGLISYAEMLNQGTNICSCVSIPVIGDGDTGYGNALNVKRTLKGYAQAGFACVMIEDQLAPKRCGHTSGKKTVGREEAVERIRAAVDARNEGADILILARTDANHTEGLDEAIYRANSFYELGADITFLEAPRSKDEMRAYCDQVPGPKLANMVEQGSTPLLHPEELREIGYKIALYPLTLMLAATSAMENALESLKAGDRVNNLADFECLRDIVGFPEYYKEEMTYATKKVPDS
jgi:2-methylisocitrate lyase-like PEP mutase family enzyme